MIVYPAIDIRGGRCVRLVEGDFGRETVFDADPVDAAQRWADAGAEWLHVVDLDAARSGRPENTEALQRIRSAVETPIQYGGGLRDLAAVAKMIDLGIDRVVLGTAAITDNDLVRTTVSQWGEQIAAGLDARDGMLAGGAWIDQTAVTAGSRARALQAFGVRHFIFTDIRRDGTLIGPNLDALMSLHQTLGEKEGLIASGGIGTIDDLSAVAGVGATGVIIGRALYDGRIDLGAALTAARTGVEVAP